jgi:exodeoxyribonuclease-5
MEAPDFRLEDIVRQQLDNPIIKLSMMAREFGHIDYGIFSKDGSVKKIKDMTVLNKIVDFKTNGLICGTKDTRKMVNLNIRERLGLHPARPCIGDRLICLVNEPKRAKTKEDKERFKRGERMYNGCLGTVKYTDAKMDTPSGFFIGLDTDDGFYWEGLTLRDQYNNRDPLMNRFFEHSNECLLFDFGYCITCHKGQGSEWESVYVIDESHHWKKSGEQHRWLYTAITRAKKCLTIIGTPQGD